MTHEDRIKKAHFKIMCHPTFCAFAPILATGKWSITTDVPTAATDGWNTYYNPDFMDEHLQSDKHLRFVVLHEAFHKAYRHLFTWQSLAKEDMHLANIAMDYVVNTALHAADPDGELIAMPAIGIPPTEKYKGWSVKQVYDDLKQQTPRNDLQSTDSHEWGKAQEVPEELRQAQANEIAAAIRQGEQLRKMRGEGVDSKDGLFDDLLQAQVPWQQVLREFVSETCGGRDASTWSRPNRRMLAHDLYMPSMYSETMGELVVGIDTSGSCFGSDMMTRFVSELNAICDAVKPSKINVIYWDTKIAGHQVFEDGQFAVADLKVQGGGGTDGSVLFDYLRQEKIRPSAVVQFTDGEVGNWGRFDLPTLWCVVGNHTAPWGVTIHVKD